MKRGGTLESLLELLIKTLSEPAPIIRKSLDLGKNDDKILSACFDIKSQHGDKKVSLISMDINLLVKASVFGLDSHYYSTDKPVKDTSCLYTGTKEVVVESGVIDEFYSVGSIPVDDIILEGELIYPNMCVTLVEESNQSKSALGIRKGRVIRVLKHSNKAISKVEPKNREQNFAIELIMDEGIKLVTLTGLAGSGKTLLSIACGIHLVMDRQKYDRLIISRPIQPMGKDIGFLPGTIEEKVDPWMAPLRDSVEFVFGGDRNKYAELCSFGYLQVEPLTYIRGRSIPRSLFILDEAQHLSKHEMKTIISRIGKDSKIILTGDIYQIDNPYLDSISNGLTCVVEKFKGYDIAGHVSLVKGQRSELATLAADIL